MQIHSSHSSGIGAAGPVRASSSDNGPSAGGAATPSALRRDGADAVSLSSAGLSALQAEQAAKEGEIQHSGGAPEGELTEEERAEVRELQARDREVRAHEQAHKTAAGDLATSGPTYEYEKGPDGNDYAVGGEVGISLEEGKTPEETLEKALRAQRAALAPAEPSSQDRAVAAEAAGMASKARAEMHASDEDRAGASQSAGGLLDVVG